MSPGIAEVATILAAAGGAVLMLVGVVGFIAWWSRGDTRRMRQTATDLARRFGGSVDPGNDRMFFGAKPSARFQIGPAIVLLEWTSGGWRGQKHTRLTRVLATSDAVSWPEFLVFDRSTIGRRGQWLTYGADDVTLGDPAFDPVFTVKANDAARVGAMWSPEARLPMLGLRDASVMCARSAGIELRAKGHRFDPEWLARALGLVHALVRGAIRD